MTAVDVLVLATGVVGILGFGVWQGYRTEHQRREAELHRRLLEALAPMREAFAAAAEAISRAFVPAMRQVGDVLAAFAEAWAPVQEALDAEVERARSELEYMHRGDDA